MPGFDVQGALKAGYSPSEIVDHLKGSSDVKFDVAGALKAGYSPDEILTHLSGGDNQPSTGYIDAAKQGIANLEGGVGETLKQIGLGNVGEKLHEQAANVAPKNYAPAQVVSDEGVSPSQLPRAVVENAPGIAASIAAARLTPGGMIPKLLAGSGVYALQTYGNKVKARAEANNHEEPTSEDKIAAAAGLVPETAVGAVGLGRFLPGAGAVRDVGARGIASAIKQLGKTALIEGATTGAQNALSQATNTAGTAKGLEINPTEVANAAAVGAGAAVPFAGPKAAHDVADAVKYRKFGGPSADATASVANDIQEKAGGPNALQPGFFNARSKEGYDAVSRAQAENKIALQRETKGLNNLPADAQDALSRAMAGEKMTEGDHQAIADAVQGQPNGDLISFLARKAAVFPKLQAMGTYDDSSGKFSGGITNKLIHTVTAHSGKTALAALFAGAAEGGPHLIAYSPEMLAAAGGAGLVARLAAQKLTHNLNPANRFVQRFANPDIQAPAVAAAQQPQRGVVSAPRIAATPGGMMEATGIGPWGPRAPAPAAPDQTGQQIRDVAELMAARRANSKLMQQQAMPLLQRLANSNAAHVFPVLAGVAGGHLAGHIGEHIASSVAHQALEGLKARMEAKQAALAAAQAAQAAPAPVPSAVLPNEIASPAKKLVSALMAQQKLKQRILGQNQADEVASGSQLIDRVGGPEAVANPEAGKRMSQMVSAANAIKKLEADLGPLPGRVNGAAATVTGMPKGAKLEVRTPGGTDQVWPPKNITKGNGKTAVDNEQFPVSSYAHLPAHEAADAILKTALGGGNVKFKGGFRASTLNRIQGERMAVDLISKEVPGLPTADIKARLEGVADQKTAKAFREHMKQKYPQAARQFDTYLSDDIIGRLWRRKG